MSEVKVNKISPRTNCGTVQLGDSGDTITIPAGATITNNGTQTGFGRTGAVDFETTPKTADFTAANGEGYFINAASGAITVTLPSSPSAGNIVAISDYNGSAATNNITIARNGSNINGDASNLTISKANSAITLVYVDATTGWQNVSTGTPNDILNIFIAATGGTEVTCGDFKTHIFTGPGTFTVTSAGNSVGSDTVDYFVVAGGGSGTNNGGGGGGGGFRLSNDLCMPAPTTSPLANSTGLNLTVQAYPITVGAGGTAPGNNGNPSTFSTITSAGGGKGGPNASPRVGGPGGSGGGAGRDGAGAAGGSGNTPPVSPPQGSNGGASNGPTYGGAGGGGGAAQAGQAGSGGSSPTEAAGDGGNGSFLSPTMIGPTAPSYGAPGPVSARYFAGGGGGGISGPAQSPGPASIGGLGGGGAGGKGASNQAVAGTVNTGGGGGGGNDRPPCDSQAAQAASGGSGVVMIRYKFQ